MHQECMCESCQSCQRDWSCSGRQSNVEQQPFYSLQHTHTYTHMHTHITSVPHTTERLCYYDAILFRTDQQLFTATVWNMQTSCQGLGAVNKYLLRLAYFIPVSSFQYWLYPPNNNNSLCDWSQEVIYTVQTQCHSPSNISNSNVMAAYCAVSRWIWKSGILSGWLFFFVPTPHPSPTTTCNKQSGDL